MKRVLLKISYDGTAYHGWQVQPNGITVQETMQNTLQQMLGTRVGITGCSRTDAGVHAKEFYCHFDVTDNIPTHAFVSGLNSLLPQDITVRQALDVAPDFHARYNAKGKTYTYLIDNGTTADPFLCRYALYVKTPLDVCKMDAFCKTLVGTHDFAAFSSIHRTVSDTVRTVSECGVTREGDRVILRVTANGFLYNMVRIIVGSALYAAFDKITPEDTERIFLMGRDAAGYTAAPHGLYLEKVIY